MLSKKLLSMFNMSFRYREVELEVSITLNCLSSELHNMNSLSHNRRRSGGAKVLGKLPVPGRPTIWITVGQGPTALAVGAGGGCLDVFTLIYPFLPLSPSLSETARYRLKYCLRGPLIPKQQQQQVSHNSTKIDQLQDGWLFWV